MTLACFSAIQDTTKTPGPGQYQTDQLHCIGGSLSLKNTIRPKYNYNQDYINTAQYIGPISTISPIKITIGKRIEKRAMEETIGPQYVPDPKETFRKSVTIKSRYEKKNIPKMPGPADYSPSRPSTTSIPAQGPRGDLFLGFIADSPGPAAYEVKSDFGKECPKVAIRPINVIENPEDTNPGYQYNELGDFGKNARKSSFGRAARTTNYQTITLGPGQYEGANRPYTTSTQLGPSIRSIPHNSRGFRASTDSLYDTRQFPQIKQRTISRQCGRGPLDYINDSPGPSYLPNTTLDLRPISIHQKIEVKPSAYTPGPGDYTPMNPGEFQKINCQLKGPLDRNFFFPDKDIPGPAAYKVETEKSGCKWTIGERSLPKYSRANTRASTLRASTAFGNPRNQDNRQFSKTAPIVL